MCNNVRPWWKGLESINSLSHVQLAPRRGTVPGVTNRGGAWQIIARHGMFHMFDPRFLSQSAT